MAWSRPPELDWVIKRLMADLESCVAGPCLDGLQRGARDRDQIRTGKDSTPGDPHALAPGESPDWRDHGQEGQRRSEPGRPLHEAPSRVARRCTSFLTFLVVNTEKVEPLQRRYFDRMDLMAGRVVTRPMIRCRLLLLSLRLNFTTSMCCRTCTPQSTSISSSRLFPLHRDR